MPKQQRDATAAELAGNTGGQPQVAGSLPSAMPPKAEGSTPAVPAAKKAPRGLMVALPEKSANLLRRISAHTKISQTALVESIEKHDELAATAREILSELYDAWKAAKDEDDPFKE